MGGKILLTSNFVIVLTTKNKENNIENDVRL